MLYRFGSGYMGGLFSCPKKKSKGRKSKGRKSKGRKSKRRRFGSKRRSRVKGAVNMVVVDPYRRVVRVGDNMIKLPKRVVEQLEDVSGEVIDRTSKIQLLDPVNGVFKISGEIVEVPFNLSKATLDNATPKRKSKRGRKSKRRSRRRSYGRRFGAFGGGRPSTLLGMEGPYMAM